MEKFDAAYFRGKSYFTGEDGTQNNLVFQVSQKYVNLNWGQEGFWRSSGSINQHLFFNSSNVNSVSIKKHSGKPAGVTVSTDFFFVSKRQRSYNNGKTHNKHLYYV